MPGIGSLNALPAATTYRLDPDLRALPELLTAATLERQLSPGTSISVMFIDQRTNHMPQTININAPLPGAFLPGKSDGFGPYAPAAGNIFQFESGGNQNVEWLELRLNSRMRRRLSLKAQYNLIDSENNGGRDNATPSNPY